MKNVLDWTIDDLREWIEKIEKKAKEFGLDFFDQIFELCSYNDMIGYMAYSGMPSSYPHWSFGKAFEVIKTMYRYKVQGLPFEMVINSDPSLAYLMEDNTLPMQLLTIAHVYGHNDFMKNNRYFSHSRPEFLLERIKARANRIRSYIEDPSIGPKKVEELLDIARALSLQRSRYFETGKHSLKKNKKQLSKEPEVNILLFIRDNNPFLESWEKDILTIIDEEAKYFIPQIETKIMNEGWAVYWHYTILKSLDLPAPLYLGFIKDHNRIVSRPKGPMPFINPYYVGFTIWKSIEKKWGRERMFFVREVDRDVSFLRQYLNRELMEELDIFSHDIVGSNRVVTDTPASGDWKEIREELIKNIGMNTIPVIKILDANYRKRRGLLLKHYFDGRELFQEYTFKVIEYIRKLWRSPVYLKTVENDRKVLYQAEGKKVKRIEI